MRRTTATIGTIALIFSAACSTTNETRVQERDLPAPCKEYITAEKLLPTLLKSYAGATPQIVDGDVQIQSSLEGNVYKRPVEPSNQ